MKSISQSFFKPILLLDWDGTIRRSKSDPDGFIKGPKDIELIAGVEDQIQLYRKKDFLIAGVSNQGGIAYGYKTPNDNNIELDATLALFKKNPFHIIKMCFHMENGSVFPYNVRSMLRKPQIGMLALIEVEAFEQAKIVIDWNNSLMVGDRTEDEQLAKNANIKFMWANDFLNPHPISISV